MFLFKILSFFVTMAAVSASGKGGKKGQDCPSCGLWQCLDSGDGSVQYLQIFPQDEANYYTLRLVDSYWSICVDEGAGNPLGVAEGQGHFKLNGNFIADGGLTLTCTGDGSTYVGKGELGDFTLFYDASMNTFTRKNGFECNKIA
jgi:hypothetical protein